MANRDQQGDPRDNERMGRGVHEGLNAGQSRNAHDSGSRGASADQQRGDASQSAGSSGESGRVQDDDDAGQGGYGNDTGFTGGTRGATDDDRSDGSRQAAPGSSGARTEDTSRSDGVGKQASSGMDERESSGEPR